MQKQILPVDNPSSMTLFDCKSFPDKYSYLAPDKSQIRVLLDVPGAGLAHCILPAGVISAAVRHQTVHEIWYVISGRGEIWQGLNEVNEFADLSPGVTVSIRRGNHFQFRNTGVTDLCILIATTPKRPGAHEAVHVEGYWT